MSNYSLNVSASALRKAAAIQDKIEDLRAQLQAILAEDAPARVGKKRGPKPGAAKSAAPKKAVKRRGKSKISPEGREKIRQAQLKRWAKQKKASKAK